MSSMFILPVSLRRIISFSHLSSRRNNSSTVISFALLWTSLSSEASRESKSPSVSATVADKGSIVLIWFSIRIEFFTFLAVAAVFIFFFIFHRCRIKTCRNRNRPATSRGSGRPNYSISSPRTRTIISVVITHASDITHDKTILINRRHLHQEAVQGLHHHPQTLRLHPRPHHQ